MTAIATAAPALPKPPTTDELLGIITAAEQEYNNYKSSAIGLSPAISSKFE